jgi:MFS family permease
LPGLDPAAAPVNFFNVTLPLAFVNFINQSSRAIMALIGPLLALEYGLSAADLGLLAAILFVAYGLMQLPVGVALDLYGPRRVQSAAAALACLGFLVSALSSGPFMLGVGRVLTGLGIAPGLIGLIKAHSMWFPRERVAALTGAGVFIGGIGGLMVTLPMQSLLPFIGWRGAFWLLAGIAAGVAIWIFLVVPESAKGGTRKPLLAEIREFGPIYRAPVFIRVVPAIVVLNAMHFTYQGLWIGPWLRDVAGMSDGTRATTLLFYALGGMFGNLLGGQIGSRLQARGRSAMTVPILAMCGMLTMQILMVALAPTDVVLVSLLWIGFACCGSTSAVAYSAVAQFYPVHLAGRVSTAVNATMLALVFLFQSGIGALLDLWPRLPSGGWDPAGYAWAMVATIIIQACAMAWMWRRRG